MPLLLFDYKPTMTHYYPAVLAGLQEKPKTLPNYFHYDEDGSNIFDEICALPHYYPTRTEVAILKNNIKSIVEAIGENAILVEYGSGSSNKTRVLLDNITDLAAYVPIDISGEYLLKVAEQLAADYPNIEVLPVCADYNAPFDVPQPQRKPTTDAAIRQVAYYPGTTIGNFHPADAVAFLEKVKQRCGKNGGFILAIDLKKDPKVIERAYNDDGGVVAKFNKNILKAVNKAVGTNFNVDQFDRIAIYNEEVGRMEMYLISRQDQTIVMGKQELALAKGERIWMDYSYKYTIEEFSELVAKAGWKVAQTWMDDKALMSILYLTPIV